MILLRPNPSSGVPIYLQLMQQIRFAIETGLLREGDQLPGIRRVSLELVINPNTVAKAYRELEHEGVIELRQGAGAFVSANARREEGEKRMRQARPLVESLLDRLRKLGLSEDEIRRLFEAELSRLRQPAEQQGD